MESEITSGSWQAENVARTYVSFFRWGKTDGGPSALKNAQIQPFYAGGDLAQRLRREITDDEAHAIARQCLNGLAEMHERGYLHLDVKPSNVLLSSTPEGRVHAVLSDFNLSARYASSGALDSLEVDRLKRASGTPAYHAPEYADERLRGRVRKPSEDVFAVGVLLHEPYRRRLPYFAKVKPKDRKAEMTPEKMRENGMVIERDTQPLDSHDQDAVGRAQAPALGKRGTDDLRSGHRRSFRRLSVVAD